MYPVELYFFCWFEILLIFLFQYFELRPIVAPIKCSVLPISANPRFEPIMAAVRSELAKFSVSYKQVRVSNNVMF